MFSLNLENAEAILEMSKHFWKKKNNQIKNCTKFKKRIANYLRNTIIQTMINIIKYE